MKYKIGDKVRVGICANRIFHIKSINITEHGAFYEIQEGIFVHECHLKPLIDKDAVHDLALNFYLSQTMLVGSGYKKHVCNIFEAGYYAAMDGLT